MHMKSEQVRLQKYEYINRLTVSPLCILMLHLQ